MSSSKTTDPDVSVIAEFVASDLLGTDMGAVDVDQNLLTTGQVDSIGMMRLVAFVEEQFNLSIPPEDFTIENFKSVNTVASYIRLRSDL